MDYKNPINIFGYLVFLYNLTHQYEVHIKFSPDEKKAPKKSEIDSIIDYLEDEGFIKPPKKIALVVIKSLKFNDGDEENVISEW